jgi:uncharacterized protein YbbK (DUF523 family)
MLPLMDPQTLYDRLHQAVPQEAELAARRFAETRDGAVWAVSACLLGIHCRYDGLHRHSDGLHCLQGRKALPLCPEVLAGLGVPRSPMAFVGGDGAAALAGDARLLDAHGRDCTAHLAAGAALALRLARAAGCESAVLKDRSPSCGVHLVHADSGLIPGRGMFTAACLAAGITVCSDEGP